MTYSATIQAEPSLVGYWKLDETSGTIATDSSAYSNDGTISGTPTMGANGLVFEPSGKCIDFDGVDDYVVAASAVSDPSEISLEAWFYSNGTGNEKIISYQDSLGQLFAVNLSTGASEIVVGIETSGTAAIYGNTGLVANDGVVRHIVATTDRVVTKVYVDGEFLNSFDTVMSGTLISTEVVLGVRADNKTLDFLTGKIQHAAIYNTALTPLQVRQHYQAGIAQGFHKEVLALNPTAYFPLNEASGDAIDWSGNDNNGTLSGDITQGATGNLAYDDSTGYAFAGVNGEISITHPASTTTYSLVALVELTSATGEYKILEDNGVGHWSISAGRQNLNYSASDHLADTSLVNGQIAVIGLSVNAGAVSFYLNGAPDGTDTAAIALDFETLSDAATSFDGSLLGISIYDSALTSAQHRTIAQSARTLIESRGYSKVIQNLNPSGYWRLGEASGTTAFDESGNDNDGTINGSPVMATSDGALHQSKLKAMTFDGVDDYIDTGYAGVSGSGNRTICAWIKPNAVGVVEYFTSCGENASGKLNNLRVNADGTLGVAYNSGYADGDTVMSAGSYYLATYVLDGTTIGDTKLYVDGVDQSLTFLNSGTTVNTGTTFSFTIGWNEALSDYIACDIGEVAYFPTALSAQQIKQIYEAGKSRYAAEVISYEPVNYFRQNEVSGNTIDLGSLGNDGVWTGSPTYGQASEVITNEADNKSIAVTASESLAFTSHAATTTYSLLSIIKPTGVAGSQEIFTDGTDSLKLNGSNLSLFYSAAEHNSNTTLVAGEAHMVGVSVNAGAATFNIDGTNDGAATSATSFAPTKLYDLTFAGTGDEAAVFGTALTGEQILDIYEMASYTLAQLTLFGIKGILTESITADQWIARTHKRDNGDFLDSYTWDGTGFYNVLTAQYEGAVDVTILQDIGLEWKPSVVTALDDRVYPTNAVTNNFYFICTTAGTTGASEPAWPGSGTIVDGTVTWTWKGGLVRPKVHGPLKPTLIA
jgi:hypothetical protein